MNTANNISDEEAYLILNNIDENIGDIKSNVEDINDFIYEENVIKDEQKTEKIDGERKKKIKQNRYEKSTTSRGRNICYS